MGKSSLRAYIGCKDSCQPETMIGDTLGQILGTAIVVVITLDPLKISGSAKIATTLAYFRMKINI